MPLSVTEELIEIVRTYAQPIPPPALVPTPV